MSRWEGEETKVQIQEEPEEFWGPANARYVTLAFATIRAAAFDPTRAAIAGLYRVTAPLHDVIGGDIIDPGEMLVLMVYRPPADDAPRREIGPSATVTAGATTSPTASWFHAHARILLLTLSGDKGTVWILGCTKAEESEVI